MMIQHALIEARDLHKYYHIKTGLFQPNQSLQALSGASFDLYAGQTLAVVGESGCGKSVTALSIMRLLPQPMGQIVSGSINFQGRDLTQLPLTEMQKIRGSQIGMVFQEPMHRQML